LRLCGAAGACGQEVTFVVHDDAAVGLDGLDVVFDDERAVSDAGIVLVATLAGRLGIEELARGLVRLRRDRPGAANAGRKVMALLFAIVLGADSIDDCDVLRAGRTRRLLGGWVPAPSTLGTFLRAFTFGHVRQLDKLLGETLARAWAAGAGPGDGRLVIDVDSFVGEVCGRLKQGAAYGYTKVLGYHPILATRADTREVLHIRLRKGSANTSKGMLRFTDELIARIDRAGAGGVKLLRADSGFWSNKVFRRLEQAGWEYSIGVRMIKQIKEIVAEIPETAWQTVTDYPKDGEAQIAETVHGGRRLIVRRTRLLGAQAELWPDWRHFCFITNRTHELYLVESEHRDHAVVEQVIADLKDQALVHFPSGHFYANSAWTVIAALAHNLLRWTQQLGLPDTPVRAARTLRRWLLHVPGRLTRHARGWTLHLPARWPWHGDYITALSRIRELPAA
jgi:Transposase DDE domain group 1